MRPYYSEGGITTFNDDHRPGPAAFFGFMLSQIGRLNDELEHMVERGEFGDDCVLNEEGYCHICEIGQLLAGLNMELEHWFDSEETL